MLGPLLDPYRGLDALKMDELVHLAAEVIPRVANHPEHGRASPVPDGRTVRYYIQKGLVDRPHGTKGTAALYGYRHLLQLLAVKVLQGQYMPMDRIREAIGGLDNQQLEERLGGWAATPRELWVQSPVQWAETRALGRWESVMPTAGRLPTGESPSRGRDAALKFLRSISEPKERRPAIDDSVEEHPLRLRQTLDVLADQTQATPEPPIDAGGAAESHAPAEWTRYELHPGVELHVRQGAEFPANPSFLSALASRLRAILERMGRRKS